MSDVKVKKEVIIGFNGYVIRALKDTDYIIAIPKNVVGFVHRIEPYETIQDAIRNTKDMIKAQA